MALIPPTMISWKLPSLMVFLMSLNREASKLGFLSQVKNETHYENKPTVCFELGNLLPFYIPEIKRSEFTACFLFPSPLPAFFPSCPPSPSLLLPFSLPLPFSLFCSCSMTDLDSNAQTWPRFISTLCRSSPHPNLCCQLLREKGISLR